MRLALLFLAALLGAGLTLGAMNANPLAGPPQSHQAP